MPSSLLTGLLAYWTMNESSGTRADYNGVYPLTDWNSNIPSVAGNLGNAAHFGAATNQLLRNAILAIGGGISFTIAYWAKDPIVSSAPHCSTIGIINYLDGMDAFSVGFASGFNYNGVLGGFYSTLSPITPLLANVWSFIVLTYNAGTLTMGISLNDGPVSTTSQGIDNPSYGFMVGNYWDEIGAGPSSAAVALDLQQMGVWSRVLAAGEITTLYNSGVGLAPPFEIVPADTTPVVRAFCKGQDFNPVPSSTLYTVATLAAQHVQTRNGHAIDILLASDSSPIATIRAS